MHTLYFINQKIKKVKFTMKSKKKLIYKLHDNVHENPFKQIQSISFRNVGIRPYDFNKLKSIRALSLKGLTQNKQSVDLQNSDWKRKLNMKLNTIMKNQDMMQQTLILNKKKVTINKCLIKVQQKKISLRNQTYQENQSTNQQKYKIIKADNKDSIENNNNKIKSSQKQIIMQINDQQISQPRKQVSIRPKHIPNHSRHASLPSINKISQQGQTVITSQNPKEAFHSIIQQQKAKQQILKQLRITAQQKINKQVMMSIKLKSNQNLQKIARSHSQVIKIDKWKQKYGSTNEFNGEETKKINKGPYSKAFLPQIEYKLIQKQENKNINEIKRYKQINTRYTSLNEDKVPQLQKSQIQIAKDLLNNFEHDQEQYDNDDELLYYDPIINLKRQYSSIDPHLHCTNISPFQQYQSRQIIRKEDQKDVINFHYSQPLKITVTKIKKHDKRNKQNLNLIKQIDKSKNNKTKQQEPINKCKQQESIYRLKRLKKSLQIFEGKNIKNQNYKAKNQQINKDNLTNSKQQKIGQKLIESAFRTRSKLYQSKVNKQGQRQDQTNDNNISMNNLVNFAVSVDIIKQRNGIKYRINQQNMILDKIVQEGIPMQWQNRKNIDFEQLQFDNFVKNQTNIINQ